VGVWQTSNLRRLRLGEEKKEERKKEEEEQTTAQKYNGPLLHRAAIKKKNKPQHENIMVCPIP